MHAPVVLPHPVDPRASHRAFLRVAALLFVVSTTVTIAWCASMSAMGAVPMPGGWTLSMAWSRMPDQTWVGAATSFVAMWVVMMVAMMLPSLVPALLRYRQGIGRGSAAHVDGLTAIVGTGYFVVWSAFGAAVFPLGAALAAVEMRLPAVARVVPLVAGVVVLLAGAFQFTAWKAHHLGGWREALARGRTTSEDNATAWRLGVRLGLHCGYCCAGPTAVLLVLGVTNLRAMAIVSASIVVERLAPGGERVARALGMVAVGVGAVLIARALAT